MNVTTSGKRLSGAVKQKGRKSSGPPDPQAASKYGSLEGSLGYSIRRAQMYAYQQFAFFMERFNIRPAQYALLVSICENPGLTQSAASNMLQIEKANLTGLLVELEERGVIERRVSPLDRRVYSLHLTPRGSKLCSKLMLRHAECEKALTQRVGKKERALLLTLLHKLVRQ